MKKLTKTNFKIFIKKNAGNLFINKRADFDGMTDCVQYDNDSNFRPLIGEPDFDRKNNYGLQGVWLVGGGRDYFEEYPLDAQGFEGVEVSNCCGHFVVAIKKESEKPQKQKTKFLIKVETKQVWSAEIEAETLEEAREIRDKIYVYIQDDCVSKIEENIKATQEPAFKCIEVFGGDDLSDFDIKTLQDLTQIKTTKAFRSDTGMGFYDTAWCPECKSENSEDIFLGGSGRKSSDFDTDEANAKIFECRCFNCGKMFRVDYFKEV